MADEPAAPRDRHAELLAAAIAAANRLAVERPAGAGPPTPPQSAQPPLIDVFSRTAAATLEHLAAEVPVRPHPLPVTPASEVFAPPLAPSPSQHLPAPFVPPRLPLAPSPSQHLPAPFTPPRLPLPSARTQARRPLPASAETYTARTLGGAT